MRRIKRKYKSPRTSWDSDEIKSRKGLASEYGLRRRKEILIAQEKLRKFRRMARELIAKRNEEKTKELLEKLAKLGLLETGKTLDDVLALTVKNILERRLQTIVWKKGIASTPRQSRQFIVHGKVSVAGRRVKSPSYIVPVIEEGSLTASMPKKEVDSK